MTQIGKCKVPATVCQFTVRRRASVPGFQDTLLLLDRGQEKMQPVGLTISKLADSYGVSLRTLRFYEERGLLQPSRMGSIRIYTTRDRVTLELILKGKRLGFSLREIERLIGAGGSGDAPDVQSEPAVDLAARLNTEMVRDQLRTLEDQRDILDSAISELRLVLSSRA